MNGFFVSMVFFGVLLVIFSLICIFLDKKKVFSFIKTYDEKKQNLVEIMNDAEEMIEELNRFSDYIVNQMDLKNEELSMNLKTAEEKVGALKEKTRAICSETEEFARMDRIECGKTVEMVGAPAVAVSEEAYLEAAYSEAACIEQIPVAIAVNGEELDIIPQKLPIRKNEKVIPINNRYSEVIRLSTEGMSGLEIAKGLNMGKGEVELILGLRK